MVICHTFVLKTYKFLLKSLETILQKANVSRYTVQVVPVVSDDLAIELLINMWYTYLKYMLAILLVSIMAQVNFHALLCCMHPW